MQNNPPPPEQNQSREWSLFGFVNAKLKRGFVIAILTISICGNIYFIYNDNRKEDIYRKLFIKIVEKQTLTDARKDTLQTR